MATDMTTAGAAIQRSRQEMEAAAVRAIPQLTGEQLAKILDAAGPDATAFNEMQKVAAFAIANDATLKRTRFRGAAGFVHSTQGPDDLCGMNVDDLQVGSGGLEVGAEEGGVVAVARRVDADPDGGGGRVGGPLASGIGA
jgi:hypothetical protein